MRQRVLMFCAFILNCEVCAERREGRWVLAAAARRDRRAEDAGASSTHSIHLDVVRPLWPARITTLRLQAACWNYSLCSFIRWNGSKPMCVDKLPELRTWQHPDFPQDVSLSLKGVHMASFTLRSSCVVHLGFTCLWRLTHSHLHSLSTCVILSAQNVFYSYCCTIFSFDRHF